MVLHGTVLTSEADDIAWCETKLKGSPFQAHGGVDCP